MPFQDDIDDFMAKRKPSAPKPVQPADDDVDSFMSKRQPALKSPASTYPSSPSAPIVNTAPKMLPTYEEWRKSGATDVPDSFRPDLSHWQNAKMPDANDQMQDYPARELDPGPNDGEMHDTWFDANKPYKSETVTYKPKGVAPITRAVDPRARQAAQISRQINQQRDEATRLFKQADATQLERTGGNFSNVEGIRAQAEGKLAAANELARRAQKTHGDLLEVGFGKDADPNSLREWAYAKPKAPKAMEESDALAIQRGNNQRFADPNGLNQALNVTPEAKARFDQQRKIEGIQQSSYPGLDPVARFGSRVWQGLKGESGADIAEAYPPVLPGEEDVNRVIQSGVKGAGSMVRGGATALPYAFPIVDAMSKGLTGRPLRSYTEGLGRPMESAIGRGAEAVLPENPANQSFLAKTERGLGSMAPAMGGAIATGGGSLAAGALGALTNLGQVATERDQSKVPVSDLRRVSSDALAIATGMTEALGMGKLLNRMGLSTPLVHRLAQMVEEGGQEYAQDYLNDINAKLVAAYDPQRQINDPLAAKRLESAAIGAILGFGGEVADYAGGKLQNQIAAPSIRAERAPMQDIRPTTLGPTQVTPLTPKATRTAVAETATPVSAIDQTVPKSAIDQTEPQIAAESPSALPRLPEPEGFNARRAQMLGMELPAEVSINERLQKADKLASSQNENDQKLGKRMLKQTLADIQKSEGYLTEFDLPDGAPRPYTAVKNALEARLSKKPVESQTAEGQVPLNVSKKGKEDARLAAIEIEQKAAAQAAKSIESGRFSDAKNALTRQKDALLSQRGLIDRNTPQGQQEYSRLGDQIQGIQRQQTALTEQARQAARRANAPTTGISKENIQIPQPGTEAGILKPENQNSAPLLRPEAIRNPEGGIPQMPEQTFSGRLEQGIRKQEAQKPSAPAKRLISRIQELGGISNRYGGELQGVKDARRIGIVRNKAEMSPDILARQLQSEGYDIDPENLDTLWAAIDRDVAGKNERPANTADLDQRLREEEAAHYAKQEEAASEPTKSFDQIATEVEGDSDTAALRRSIARSNERGHVMPESGRGLVSMSPYADMKARNAEAVDRLYEVGPASQEGREIINNLRAFNKQNGIESRHLGNLINDVKNFQMERARWKEEGLSLDTVQQALDSETTLKDRVREATAKLPDNQRTAIEREVAALDELYDDADAMNLLDRIVEGDNNAVNEFKQKAGEYGLEPDTIAELVGARESERTVRQAEIAKARAKNEHTQAPAQESREARSATPDEFDLLNRNPATIPKDEFDQHLLAVEKLRNDEIRGIVKLPRDDRRQMYKHLRNLNEERKFRVKRGELPAKYERLPVPTMEERRAMWAKGDQWNAPSAPKAREHKAAESRAESDILSDAKIQFKSGKRNQPGTLYADENALHVLRAAYEEVFGSESDFKAVNLNKAASRRIAEVLQTEAKDADYPTAVQRKLRQVAREFTMAARSGETVSIVSTAEGRTLSEIKGDRRYELFHDAQEGLANSNDFLARHKYSKQIIEGLSHYSFEDRTIEAAAHAAAGQGNEIGLNDQQAREFLNDYFDDVVKNNGREALERFALMSPRTQEALKQARERHGIKLQEKTARTGERVEGQRGGAVGATASAARESKRIPRSDKAKRASFGELENEPRGQVLASGFNIQDLFNRKKEAKPEPNIELPKDWDAKKWAKKTYTDALVNALPPKVRAEYGAAKTEKEKLMILMSNADPDVEAKIFKLVDKVAEAADKNDGRRIMEAVRDAKEYSSEPATNLEKLSAMRKASMLLRVTTHARNVLGNTVFQPLEEAARVPGSVADSVMGLITGRRTLKGANPAEMWRSTTVAADKGWQQAKDAMRGLDPEDLEKAFQVKEIKFKNPVIDKVVKFSFRSLNAEDKVFYTYAYDRALREQAKLTALNERKNGMIERKDQERRTKELYNEPTVEMDVDATAAAEVAVFRNKNILSTGIQSARTAMGDKGAFAVDMVLPFDKTPTNIIARTLEYTPLGGVIAAGKAVAFGGRTVKEYRAARKEGTPSKQAIKEAVDKAMTPAQQRSFSQLVGRSATGTAAPILLGYYLASLGMATGAYDEDDRKENEKRRNTNTPPASIKIGGRWYQVGGLPPLGSLIAMGATLHEEVNKEGADAESIALGTAKGVGQIASDVPLLRSTKDAVEGLTKEGRAGQKVGRIASSFIPGGLSDLGQVIPGVRDPYERQTRSDKKVKGLRRFGRDVAGEVAGKIPGLRRLLPPKTDGAGRKIETEWSDVIDPFSSRPVREGVEKPAKTRIADTGEIETSLPKQKPNEPEEIYKKRVERVNQWMDTYGERLVNDPRYQALPPDLQESALQNLRNRIGRQQNMIQPQLNRNGEIESFTPGKVLEGVNKSVRQKPRRDAKKLWVAPPK